MHNYVYNYYKGSNTTSLIGEQLHSDASLVVLSESE